jgi:hypothetical protein
MTACEALRTCHVRCQNHLLTMRSLWGHRAQPVDLTLDSDDDGGQVAFPQTEQKLHIPLPPSVCHLYPSAAPPSSRLIVPLPGSRSSPALPSQKPVPYPSSRPLQPTSTSINGHVNGDRYVPLYAGSPSAHMDEYPSTQPGKRRKLSDQQPLLAPPVPPVASPETAVNGKRSLVLTRPPVESNGHDAARRLSAQLPHDPERSKGTVGHGAHTMEPPHYRAGLKAAGAGKRSLVLTRPPTESNGHDAPRRLSQHMPNPTMPTASTPKLATNGLPSVQSLNSALNTNAASIPSTEAHRTTQPRTLQLERLHDDAIGSSLRRFSAEQAGLKRTSTSYNKTNGERAAPLNGRADELIVDRDDDNLTKSFTFRTSPMKKAPVPPAATPFSNERHVVEQYQHITKSRVPAPMSATPSQSPASKKKFAGTFSEEESHLLIFLKEVKRLSWKDLVTAFNSHLPGRKYHTLQSHYSTKLNKRDRAHDPAVLTLPLCYAAESTIDWVTVHELNPGSRANRETAELQHQAHGWQRSESPRTRFVAPDAFDEQLFEAPSTARAERPKRAVPAKNYASPKRNRHVQGDHEVMDDGFDFTESMEFDMESRSDESAEALQPPPKKAIAVDNDPLPMNFERHDAALAFSGEKVPYLASSDRVLVKQTPDQHEWDQLSSRDWTGLVLHVDFRPRELEVVERAIRLVVGLPQSRRASRRKQLRATLYGVTEPKFLQLVDEIYRRLPTRDKKSIESFLRDAQTGRARICSPRIERLAPARPDIEHCTDPKLSTLAMIRQREVGLQNRRGWRTASRPLTYQFKNKVRDSLGPAFSYTGASSDVHAVAWSADGQSFAAGAICVDDPHSMQYNRPNNLLFGDVRDKAIYELGEHKVSRPRPESGPNSSHAMYASQDPNLYKTVSAVAFSPNGRFMYSGGYDNCVCVWETRTNASPPEFVVAMKHKAEIDMLAVNQSGLLATASKKGDNHAVKVIAFPDDDPHNYQKWNLGSRKAAENPNYKILPTALQFSPRHEGLLLAGFGANARSDGRDTNGDICLWDIEDARNSKQLHVHGSGKNVFDLAFHNRHPWFAVGCVAGQNVNRGTRSIIRIYDENGVDLNNGMKYGMRMELECKALDMNDVVWW